MMSPAIILLSVLPVTPSAIGQVRVHSQFIQLHPRRVKRTDVPPLAEHRARHPGPLDLVASLQSSCHAVYHLQLLGEVEAPSAGVLGDA